MAILKQKSPIELKIENFFNREIYTVQSVDESYKFSFQDINDIAMVCNEPHVYDFLFRHKLNGEIYSKNGAFSFINYSWEGWRNDEKYTFTIRNPNGNIVGALDIKSNNLEEGEIGYG